MPYLAGKLATCNAARDTLIPINSKEIVFYFYCVVFYD